jgi:hypothetical protein
MPVPVLDRATLSLLLLPPPLLLLLLLLAVARYLDRVVVLSV